MKGNPQSAPGEWTMPAVLQATAHRLYRAHFDWILRWPQAAVFLLTLICLLPFSGKAFRADDSLFIRSAQQITKHPFDPYGFPIFWYVYEKPMWRVPRTLR